MPLRPGMRVLEIGCGPGAAAREVARRVGDGFVLAIDRSAAAVEAAERLSKSQIAGGRLAFRRAAAEEFELEPGEEPFDLAFAVRVGAFDGRHPEAGEKARARLLKALKRDAPFYIDGGEPIRPVRL